MLEVCNLDDFKLISYSKMSLIHFERDFPRNHIREHRLFALLPREARVFYFMDGVVDSRVAQQIR